MIFYEELLSVLEKQGIRCRIVEGNDSREPRRILQLYDPLAQAAFRSSSAKDKLEWLASINKLYWAAIKKLRSKQENK